MKKILILLTILAAFTACKNDDETSSTNIIEQNIAISNVDTYEYDLGSFGDEEGAGFLKQAEHFEISELQEDISTGQIIYKYKPTANYVGPDYVEITTGRGSNGASPNTNISIVKITFTITQ